MRQFAVIGLGRFGMSLAKALAERKAEVIAVDRDPKRVEAIQDIVDAAIQLDATDQTALAQAGVGSVNVAIVAIGDDLERSVLVTIILREMNIPRIIVKGQNEEHGKILRLIGANEVIYPEEEYAERLAQKIITDNVVEMIPIIAGYSIVEIVSPKEFHGRTLLDINVRRNYGVEILAIRKGEYIKVIPSPLDVIEQDDVLMILGKDDDIEKLRNM